VTSDMAHAFTPEDLELVSAVAVLAGQAISYARTHQLLLQLERTQIDFDAARDIQMAMVRHTRPKVRGYRFADYYKPAQKVGGDYYFYETLPDGRVILGIADASGKGLAAAMAIARFAGEVRFRIATSPTLKKALSDLNCFVADSGPLTFITSCICVLDPKTHALSIASAGHLPPLRRRRDSGAVERIETPRGGLPLGIDEASICHPFTTTVEPGDRIVLTTDGATEAMDQDNILYGTDRLMAMMHSTCGSIDEFVATIVADIDAHRNGRAANDDICLVAMERIQ